MAKGAPVTGILFTADAFRDLPLEDPLRKKEGTSRLFLST
jgi:hypothetical protein